MTNLCWCLPYSWPTQTNRYLSSCILVRYWRSTLKRNTRLLKVTEDIGLSFRNCHPLMIKFMRMTAVLMVTWNPEGRVMEVFRLNQLLTKMWVHWALPSSWVCCWSVISGSREYFVISFRPETIFLTWYENQTKKFEQTEFISKTMFNSFKLEIILFLQLCYLFSPIYFLLRYFCIIHFSFQIDMQCKLKLNPFLVRLFAELWPWISDRKLRWNSPCK